jgi:uncharacterized protein (TIGR03437 family)
MRLFLLFAAAAAWAAGGPAVTHTVHAGPGQGRIESPFVFRAVAVAWDGAAADRSIALRASTDGVVWTAWLPVGAEDAAPRASGLVYLDGAYRYLELSGDSAGADVILIDPGATQAGLVPKAQTGRDTVAAPAIVTREQWGCTTTTCPAASAPQYTTVTHLIVHHTAGANTATDWAAVVRSIWVLHVQGNGWNDIGYNYLIDPNGLLYEGRAGGDGVLGAHFSGVNGGTMGVSTMGTYSTVAPSDPAVAMLTAMLAWQAAKWNIEPAGQSLHTSSGLILNHIAGHRDAGLSPHATSTTECPGNALYARLPDVRSSVRTTLRGACPQTVSPLSYCAGAEAGTVDVTVTTPAGCAALVSSTASWIAAEVTGSGSRLSFEANAGVRRSGTVSIGGDVVTLTQAAAGEPSLACIAQNGVVTAGAVDDRAVTPGSLISVFGTNLAPDEAFAADYPLPTTLGGVALLVNGSAVPLSYAGPGQINAQLPATAATGSARAAVRRDGVTGPETMFWVSEAIPSIFTAGGRAIAVNHDDGRVNSAAAPVRAGGILTVWLEGVGAVQSGLPADGTAASDARRATLPSSATVAGRTADLGYLGLAPGLAGVYQANVTVPGDTPVGDCALAIAVSGVTSQPATVTVQAGQ